MALHFFNLASASAQLQEYADENGWVPEIGDRWQDFHWNPRLHKQFSDLQSGKVSWQAFTAQARIDTKVAFKKLQNLEEQHPPLLTASGVKTAIRRTKAPENLS